MTQTEAVKTVILSRLQARREREFLQRKLLPENDDFHETIRCKLQGRWDAPQYWNFSRCGSEDFFRTCKNCGTVEKFKYQCSIKWCPRCSWKITETRKNLLRLWTQRISQPKHMVLTQKNFPILTRRKIREHTRSLMKLRRAKCFRNTRGGCVSVEITNEGNGWHLHSHWLLDAEWLPMADISVTWGKLVGQEFAICKCKDVRGTDYVNEVSKYVCEGSELAKWPPEQINEFVRAVKGLRFFFAFGTLRLLAPTIRAELAAQKEPPPICDCGCSQFIYEDEQDAMLHEVLKLGRR
jgi:hypothetical protein